MNNILGFLLIPSATLGTIFFNTAPVQWCPKFSPKIIGPFIDPPEIIYNKQPFRFGVYQSCCCSSVFPYYKHLD